MRYFKTIILFSLILCLTAVSAFSYFAVGLENFSKIYTYSENTFLDLDNNGWYKNNVKDVYEYGLMNGAGNSQFKPMGNVTIAESITVAVRINNIYNYAEPFYTDADESYSNWYEPYITYAKDMEIISKEYPNYTAPATRAEFAQILARSISDTDLQEINYVADGAIPDVDMTSEYADSVYLLYRAGILTGSDDKGSFNPDTTITRAEAAAIITRIIDTSSRKSIELF